MCEKLRNWNDKSCEAAAFECDSIKEFIKKYSGAYKYAKRHNLVKKICCHMAERQKNKIIIEDLIKDQFYIDRCLETAALCFSKSEFAKNFKIEYTYARKTGILDKCCGHMIPTSELKKFSNTQCTYSYCRLEALRFNSKKEFKEESCKAYRHACRNGFLDEICSHMPKYSRLSKWNIENLHLMAKRHNSRNSFKRIDGGAYTYARKHGLLDQIFANIPKYLLQNRREEKLQKQIFSKLQKQYKHFDIYMEVITPRNNGKNGRIDFIIKNPANGKFIGLELKHKDSFWTKNECESQLLKYKLAYKGKKGFNGIFLISNSKKIGEPIEMIHEHIKKIL
jgi:hypothetical protein